MSNSSLVTYTKISPNSNNPRNQSIKKITIHHMAGNISVETCGSIFANPDRQSSSNYGIGTDGRIALYVEEKNRSWCSSSPSNDHQAVTIEVANSAMGGDWPVSDKALAALIDLCTDICKRNGIAKLNYTGDANGNLTRHNMFAATACPGPYLQSKFPTIAEEVNKRLQAPAPPPVQTDKFKVGDTVIVNGYPCVNAGGANPGSKLTNYTGKVTKAYPTGTHRFHVDQKGWCREADLRLVGGTSPTPPQSVKVGSKVRIKPGVTKFTNGVVMAGFLKSAILYVRQIDSGKILVSTQATGNVYTGWVYAKDLEAV